MLATKKNTKSNNRPIGVFDSGVGGLSVLKELWKLLPKENFIFIADQLYVPYGEKTKKELVGLGLRVTDYFIQHHDIKLMVVACNTSTCSTIGELRKKYTLPIVGTVPAVKSAAESTKTKTIAIISTPSTSQSETLKKLIKDNCKNIKVFNIGCKNLENAVEHGELNSEEVQTLLLKYLSEVRDSDADYLVLGCTHYVFINKTIAKFVGSKIKLIDGNKAIARQTQSLLQNHILETDQKKLGKTVYFTTGDSTQFSKVASKLLKEKIKAKSVKI